MIYPILKSGKIIGWMDVDNSRYVSDRSKETFFYKHNGFGLSLRVLNLLRQYDIKEVIIRYEGIRELKCLVSDFFEYGKRWTDNRQEYPDVDGARNSQVYARDNGKTLLATNIPDEQLILPLIYFNKGQEVLI